MKKILFIILLSFLCIYRVHADTMVYSNWIDYYPEGVDEFRIESEVRYRWFKIDEDGNRHETSDYYTEYEDYEIIEGSEKTYYRVINNEYVYITADGEYTFDSNECKKIFCAIVFLKPFEETQPEIPTIETPEEPINPETLDNIYLYLSMLIVYIFIIIIYFYQKRNLVMSNH